MISTSLIGLLLAGSALAFAPAGNLMDHADLAGNGSLLEEGTGLELRIPVQGLDERNAPVIERSLGAIVDESDPPEKVLGAVEVDIEGKSIQVTVAPGKSLHLAQIEKSLAPSHAKIQRQGLHLAAGTFVVDSESEGDLGKRIQSALEEARLFENVEVRAEAGSQQRYQVTVKGGDQEKASIGAVDKALEGVSPALKLSDVVWTAPKAKDQD